MVYIKPRPGPIEERDFDQVVPVPERKFLEIEEFSGEVFTPEDEAILVEGIEAVLVAEGVDLPTLCAGCDGPTPSCPNCKH